MMAALKGLYSDDISDLKTYSPSEDNNFGLLVRVMVGPMDGQGEESFEVLVCTPQMALREQFEFGHSAWTAQTDRI